MSDSSEHGHRTRRRAMRTAGPPAGENSPAGENRPAGGSPSPGENPPPGESTAPTISARAAAAPKSGAAGDSGPRSVRQADVGADPGSASAGRPAAVDLGKTSSRPAPDESTDQQSADGDTSVAAPASGSTESDQPALELSPDKPRSAFPRILAVAASALLVLALVCGAALSVFATRSADAREARRDEYVQTARQAIINLTTIRADSAKQDIDRILSLASGEFKTEFDGRVDPFTSIVQQAKVVSNGEVTAAAVESDDESSARVLVAAKQTLTNAGQAAPQTRYYRFRVTVTRGDSGLSVSNVEFVA